MPALVRGAAHMSAYAASKAAVLNFSQSLASELAADHITVNAIAPSMIDTPANRQAMPDADTGDWLAPEDIVHRLERGGLGERLGQACRGDQTEGERGKDRDLSVEADADPDKESGEEAEQEDIVDPIES